MAVSAWNPSDAFVAAGPSPGFSWSNSDKTATANNGAWSGVNWVGARATTDHGTGKYHFEVHQTAPSYIRFKFGLMNSTPNVISGTSVFPGQTSAYGIGFSDYGSSLYGGDTQGQLTVAGRPVAIEVDLDAELAWIGIDIGSGTTFDKNFSRRSNADPLTGTNYAAFSSDWLTITGGTSNNCMTRCTSWRGSGKYYFEVLLNNEGDGIVTGFVNSSINVTTADGMPGGAVGGVGYWGGGGGGAGAAVFVDGVSVLAMPGLTTADVVCVAVDFDNGRIWFRKNGGDWNNNASYDPATNTGGVDISGITGPLFPTVCVTTGTESATVNFGASAFAHTQPSGFSDWDDGVTRMVWNGSDDTGVQNPATGTGGFAISGSTGPFFPAMAVFNEPLVMTGMFSTLDMQLPVSAGFSDWDDTPASPPAGGYRAGFVMAM